MGILGLQYYPSSFRLLLQVSHCENQDNHVHLFSLFVVFPFCCLGKKENDLYSLIDRALHSDGVEHDSSPVLKAEYKLGYKLVYKLGTNLFNVILKVRKIFT